MPGLTETGFDTKALDTIIAEIEAEVKSTIDANLNTESDSVAGQLIGIFSDKLREVWELSLEIWQSSNPDTASGQSLSYLSALTGTIRYEATYSTVQAYLQLETTTTEVLAGSAVYVEGDPGSRYELTADHTQTGTELGVWTFDNTAGTPNQPGEAEPNASTAAATTSCSFDSHDTSVTDRSDEFVALEVGDYIGVRKGTQHWTWKVTGIVSDSASYVTVPVEFVSGDDVTFPLSLADASDDNDLVVLTATTKGSTPNATLLDTAIIATPVGGWTEAVFETDAAPGDDEETDDELRVRRLEELSRPGSATVNAIRADLLELTATEASNVTTCNVFENASGLTDAQGLPPYSIEVLVNDNGVDLLVTSVVAQQILDAKPAGTETYGSLYDTATDDGGTDHTIYYSVPTEVQAWVDLTITTDPATYVGDAAVAEAISLWADDLLLGEDIYASDIINVVADLIGVVSITPSSVKVDDQISPVTDELILSARQRGTIATADVTVVSS